MTITTISSGDFDRDTSGAKRAAKDGPVIITDRDQPAYVLLTIEDYRKLAGERRGLADMLAMHDGADIEFDPPKLRGPLWRPADLT